jgi:integrase
LRWSDLDLDSGSASVRRSAVLIKSKGMSERIVFGEPKSGKARVIDLDAQTVAVLRAPAAAPGHRVAVPGPRRRPGAVPAGRWRHAPGAVQHDVPRPRQAAAKALGEDVLPVIRLHDLRHSHGSLLLAAGVPVKVVSERLGHTTPMITLTVYAHTMPGMQCDAVDRLAAAVFGG